MIKKLFFSCLFFISLLKAQEEKTVYLDQNLKETTKENAANYNQLLRLNDIVYVYKLNQNIAFFSENNQVFQFIVYSGNENKEPRPYSVLMRNPSKIKEFPKDTYYQISEIKSQSTDDLNKKILNTVFTVESNRVRYRYFFLTPEILVKQELTFRDDKLRGFGSVEVRDDNDVEKWRVDRVGISAVRMIYLNGEKPVLQTAGSDYISIIPTQKGLLFDNRPTTETTIETVTEDETGLNRAFYFFNYKDYYRILNENGKQILYNKFGKALFQGDEIDFNSKFIVVKNGSKTEIYNHFLKNISPLEIKSAHLFPDFVNVLQGNEVKNINFFGRTYYKPSIQSIECGTGRCSYSEIMEQDQKTNELKLLTSTSCGHGSRNINITFQNLENVKAELISKNNLKEENAEAIQYFSDKDEKYFIVSKNGKYGLYTHNEKDSKSISEKENKEEKPKQLVAYRTIIDKKTKKKRVIKDIFMLPEKPISIDPYTTNYTTNATELLPIEYDTIELKNGLFILVKNGLYSIYKQKFSYKNIGKRVGSFIEIESTTGQKGWLDLETKQEFYNN